MIRQTLILVATTCLALSSTAYGAAIITVRQIGSDVVITGSGTMNITGMNPIFSAAGWTSPSNGNTSARVGGGGVVRAFNYHTGPSSFGPASGVFANIVSGDQFGVTTFNSRFFVPDDYISGSLLFGTAIHQNTTLTDMGMNEGVYTFGWGSAANADTLTVDIAIPEPSSLALLAGASLLMLRRRHTC